MLIEFQTAAKTQSVKINASQTLQVRGTLAETISLEIPDGEGGWNTLYEDGVAVVLDATHLQITAYGDSLIRVNKPITVASVGVTVIG